MDINIPITSKEFLKKIPKKTFEIHKKDKHEILKDLKPVYNYEKVDEIEESRKRLSYVLDNLLSNSNNYRKKSNKEISRIKEG